MSHTYTDIKGSSFSKVKKPRFTLTRNLKKGDRLNIEVNAVKIMKIKDKELLKNTHSGSGIGLYENNKLVGFILYTWEGRELYLDAIAVQKEHRKHSSRLMRSGLKIIKKGVPKRIWGDSQSSKGEALMKSIGDIFPIPAIDMGKLDRCINGEKVQDSGSWQKYI